MAILPVRSFTQNEQFSEYSRRKNPQESKNRRFFRFQFHQDGTNLRNSVSRPHQYHEKASSTGLVIPILGPQYQDLCTTSKDYVGQPQLSEWTKPKLTWSGPTVRPRCALPLVLPRPVKKFGTYLHNLFLIKNSHPLQNSIHFILCGKNKNSHYRNFYVC